MINIIEKTNCCGCYGCFNVCPKNAIDMEEDEKGFKYPKVNKEKCINCNLCEKVCPIINKKKNENNPKAYAIINKDEKIRAESSSGGMFSALASYILDNDGYVFGAAFDEEFLVDHIMVDNKHDLYKLRTSKYLQSNIKNTYKQTKELLEENKKVLFTGTPCQVNGLLSYLGKEYENLYTQDIICHGVPSPKVWKKYLEYRKEKDSKVPIKINFRQKDNGWNSYELLLQYNNNSYKRIHKEDFFMRAFLNNACLRESCYNCNFKDKNRNSDITLADFWGIDNVAPKMNDNKGTSLVIVNTKKGEELLRSIKDKIEITEVNFEKSIQYNSSMYKSAKMPKNREKFFQNLNRLEFDKLVNKYFPKPNIIKRIFKYFKKVLKKILSFFVV